ncbi:Wzz/FepE/Etk N-terminal domain-containing protein [Rhizobium tumorigenes]|uniref:Wzz/FepE/Etk N-terminal domain-containing protein n=1 Tax=Rhizobium tumorigenes TaxID=2041385 RepID=UPI00241DA816|nr:Wzz/FepE/Etk N-terminal domain-containing protein [Rhizobium tumorigenes]WFS03316.1 Wzz/FepE/Etk N-terminal domain-containing protein [Rhizobium tumorigenes]
MTNNGRQAWEDSTIWRLNTVPTEIREEGPIALMRAMFALANQHKIKLISFTAVGLMVGAIYAQSLPKTYTAAATLLLEPSRQGGASGQDSSQTLDLNRADSQLQIIKSERLLATVFDNLNLQSVPEFANQSPRGIARVVETVKGLLRGNPFEKQNGPSDESISSGTPGLSADAEATVKMERMNSHQAAFLSFAKNLDARRVGQSYVIEIEYSSSNPLLPALVANAAVSAYILQSVSAKDEVAKTGFEALQWRLDALSAQVKAATFAVKHGTLPEIPTPDADARIIGAALAPLGPSGPRSTLIVILGGVLGLLGALSVLGLGLAFNRKIRDAKELTRDTGLVCLGIIPKIVPRHKGGRRPEREKGSLVVREPRGSYASAIRDLRTSIEIACGSFRAEKSIVVALASWEGSSGITSLSRGLAELISHSGRQVTLFAGENAGRPRPISDVTSAPSSLAEILVNGARLENIKFEGEGSNSICVLPIYSANTEFNFFADFRDRRVTRIVDAARTRGDVLIDLPPLSASSDALALSLHADVVVVVVQAGKTTTEEAVEIVQRMRRSGANVIGTVIH